MLGKFQIMVADFATAVRQFWKGYINSPPGC
jgi:hypothetical protein